MKFFLIISIYKSQFQFNFFRIILFKNESDAEWLENLYFCKLI